MKKKFASGLARMSLLSTAVLLSLSTARAQTTPLDLTLEAENMALKTTGSGWGTYWGLWNNGYVESQVTFAKTAVHQFTVTAYGSVAESVWPTLELRLDGATVASTPVNSGTAKTYTFTVNVSEGAHKVGLAFSNDRNNGSEDRNLILDKVRILQTATSAPSTAPVAPATIEAEAMETKTVGGVSGIYWMLWSNGRIENQIQFKTAGAYDVKVTARGTLAASAGPNMDVLLNGARVTGQNNIGTTLQTYTLRVNIAAAGTHKLGFAFTNDARDSSGDRNLYIDKVSVAAATTTPPPTPTPVPPIGGQPAVRQVGRFDFSDTKGPRFSWPGSMIEARFSGTSVSMRLSNTGETYFAVVIDNRAPIRVRAAAGIQEYSLATGLAAGTHVVRVYRDNESNHGVTQFLGFNFGSGGQLLAPDTTRRLRMEVVGDSISVGYGNLGVGPSCGYTAATSSNYAAYGSLAARALNADVNTVAISGIGAYHNYGSAPGDASSPPIASHYPLTMFSWSGEFRNLLYNFNGQSAKDVVVINIGTNDFSNGVHDAPGFTAAYQNLVKLVRSKNPTAHIFLVVGSLIGGAELTQWRANVQTVMNNLKAAGDSKLYFVEFPAQDGARGYGCDYHPSAKQHELMGGILTDAIKKVVTVP